MISLDAFAGSCCGGGASSVSFITGDAKNVFRSSYSNRTILADVDSDSKITNRSDDQLETIENIKISSNHKISTYWQVGFSIPYITKSREINDSWKSESGIGDVSLNTAFEFYPEFTRRQFITQAFVYSSITLPSSPSLFDSNRSDLLDTRGQGHYLVSLGLFLKKKFSSQEILLNLALTYRLGREFKDSQFSDSITTENSLDNIFTISHVYNFSSEFSSTIALARSFVHQQAVSVFSKNQQSLTLNQVTLGLNYSFETVDINLTYIDDFLLGQSRGTILGRSLALGLVKRI